MHLVYGRMGTTTGFYTNQPQITEDNDGVFTSSYFKGVIDLTHILSRALGKQLSQMATYRVNFLSVSLRNVDDTLDNDSAGYFGGNLRWVTPSKHRIDALQLARQYRRETGLAEISSDPFATISTDKKYKGFRFNWDDDGQIDGATTDGTAALAGTYFDMASILEAYNLMMGGTPSSEGYDTTGQGQALWEKRVGMPVTNGLQFVTSIKNREVTNGGVTFNDYEVFDPQSVEWTWTAPAGQTLPVLGGLLLMNLTHGNTDAPGVVEDEYEMLVTVGVEGWEEF